MKCFKIVAAIIFIGCSVHGMQVKLPVIDISIAELEKSVPALIVSAQNKVECAKAALDCWYAAHDFLNNQFDNENAIKWFGHFIRLYDGLAAINYLTPVLMVRIAPAFTGMATAFHNERRWEERDLAMVKAQQLLEIPDKIKQYIPADYKTAACEYFIVDGYKHYAWFQESEKNKEPVDIQEKQLQRAMNSFQKAVTISDALPLEGLAKSYAMHGNGTIHECLGKCWLKRSDTSKAAEDFQQAINCLSAALALQQRMLGKTHPAVGCSFHGLARNYVLLAEASHRPALMGFAVKSFKQALDIFAQSRIPQKHPLRAEFDEDYRLFREQYCDA